MTKKTIIFVLLCVVWLLTGIVSAGQLDKSANSGDVNNVNIAIQAFELRIAGKVAEAKQLLERAVRKNPKNAEAQFELARIYFHISCETLDLDLAQKTIERAIELEPDNARFHYWSGEIAMYNGIIKMRNLWGRLAMPGQMRKAIKSFKRAVELKSDFHEARLSLMGCYDRLPWYCGGSKSKAKEQARKLEQMDAVYGARALCELRPIKKRAEIIDIWTKVVTKFPDNAAAHAGLARVYMHEGDLPAEDMEKAEEHIKKALELDPSKSRILLDLAWHYGQSKQLEKAEEAVRDYLEIESAGPASMRAYALRWLGLAQKMKGKDDESKETLKKARELDKYLWPTRVPPPEDLFVAPPEQMKKRVGIYDSRAVAIAFAHSEWNGIDAKMPEMEKAKAAGDTKKIAELDAWGHTQQDKLHRQGFSTAAVDDIFEHIKDKLPQIRKQANVIAFVSKWDKKTLKRYKSAKLIDVTNLIVAQFSPDEKVLKTIEQLKKKKPIPLWQLEIMMKLKGC